MTALSSPRTVLPNHSGWVWNGVARFAILLNVSTAGVQRLNRDERSPAAFHGFFHLEAGNRAGLRDVGADQEQGVGSDNIFERDGPTMGPLDRCSARTPLRWPYRALLST